MSSFSSFVERPGKRDEMGEVVPIPVLNTSRKTGTSTADDWAAFEASYRENANACEVALARGILPNPQKPKADKDVADLLAKFKEGKIKLVELTMGRFQAFPAGDKEGFEDYTDKLKAKYKGLEKEDIKRRPLTSLAYA